MTSRPRTACTAVEPQQPCWPSYPHTDNENRKKTTCLVGSSVQPPLLLRPRALLAFVKNVTLLRTGNC